MDKSMHRPGGAHRSQKVTAADIQGGRIRLPTGETKRLFPAERGHVDVEVRGESFECRWDPRLGPDKERSGVLGITRERAARLLAVGDVLDVAQVGGRVQLR